MYIIIRMPDGTYAKVPIDAQEPPDDDPPGNGGGNDNLPGSRDWATQEELDSAVDDLQQQIDAERAAREQADQSLEQRMDAERTEREQADQFLQEQIDMIAGSGGDGSSSLGEIIGRVEDLEEGVQTLQQTSTVQDQRIAAVESGSQQTVSRIQVLEEKKLLVPVQEKSAGVVNGLTYQLSYNSAPIEPGSITVLSEDGSSPVFDSDGNEIRGTVSSTGLVQLSAVPGKALTFIFGVEVSFSQLPREALKNQFATELTKDIVLIKGIEQLERELDIEKITPSSLVAASIGDQVYLSWAYTDSPELSHFIVERLDPQSGQWVPYDGGSGVVPK